MIKYKKLPENRWKAYKELRLVAIKKDWISFGVAYEDEADYSKKEWQQKMNHTVFALDGEDIVGLIAYDFATLFKMRHVAYINDLYVDQAHRRIGLGSRLLKEVIKEIKKNPKIEKIKLIADPTQVGAIKLYKKFGFKKIALIKKDLKYKGKYYNDFHMEKWL
jgi:ribosomal protein S18 acetylase RimI-like enzyme